MITVILFCTIKILIFILVSPGFMQKKSQIKVLFCYYDKLLLKTRKSFAFIDVISLNESFV